MKQLIMALTIVCLFSSMSFAIMGPPIAELEEGKIGSGSKDFLTELKSSIAKDNKNFYSWGNFSNLGVGFGIGAIMANTSIDKDIQEAKRKREYPSFMKNCGDGFYLLPILAGSVMLGELNENYSLIGNWGNRTLRASLVGIVPLLVTQRLTGSSRPRDRDGSSHWKPLKNENGVSGHSFMGAIPFMTAAQMTDNWWLKVPLYAASGVCAWTRVNDNAHYTSQAVLGIWLAYSSVSSITKTEIGKKEVVFAPFMTENGAGISAIFKF